MFFKMFFTNLWNKICWFFRPDKFAEGLDLIDEATHNIFKTINTLDKAAKMLEEQRKDNNVEIDALNNQNKTILVRQKDAIRLIKHLENQ